MTRPHRRRLRELLRFLLGFALAACLLVQPLVMPLHLLSVEHSAFIEGDWTTHHHGDNVHLEWSGGDHQHAASPSASQSDTRDESSANTSFEVASKQASQPSKDSRGELPQPAHDPDHPLDDHVDNAPSLANAPHALKTLFAGLRSSVAADPVHSATGQLRWTHSRPAGPPPRGTSPPRAPPTRA